MVWRQVRICVCVQTLILRQQSDACITQVAFVISLHGRVSREIGFTVSELLVTHHAVIPWQFCYYYY